MDLLSKKMTQHAALALALAVSGVSLVGCEPATPQIEIPKDMPKPGTTEKGAVKGQPNVKSIKNTRPSGEGEAEPQPKS